MAKASLTLPNGIVIEIEGSTGEVRELLEFYGGAGKGSSTSRRKSSAKTAGRKGTTTKSEDDSDMLDLAEIVNEVKSCDEAEDIETKILDKSSQVDRTLLPLYIVHEYFENAHGLTSGDINKITTQLSVPVSTPNASSTLSGTASKYVIGDTVRKKGGTVRYKLNRRGLKYLKSVISGDSSE